MFGLFKKPTQTADQPAFVWADDTDELFLDWVEPTPPKQAPLQVINGFDADQDCIMVQDNFAGHLAIADQKIMDAGTMVTLNNGAEMWFQGVRDVPAAAIQFVRPDAA